MVTAVGIGVLVGLAIELVFAPRGRRVAELGIVPLVRGTLDGRRVSGGRGPGGWRSGGRKTAERSATGEGLVVGGAGRPRVERGAAGTAGTVGRSPLPRGHGRDLTARVVVLQVVAMLRAGSGPVAAWSGTTGVAVDPAGIPDQADLGRVLGVPGARAAVAATRLALDVGAPLGLVLEAVADSLVREAEARAERDAAIAGPRMTARVILWLPVAGAGLGLLLGADTVAVATDGGAGTAVILLGVVLLAAGWAWSSRLVAQATDRSRDEELDVQVLLELLAAALGAGVGVPRALGAVGQVAGGSAESAFRRASVSLVLGAGWDRAWTDAPAWLRPVVAALRSAWTDGAAPGEALRAAGHENRRERSAAARTAAARLGVSLVLPLGICYLPAFVLVGLVPVLLALGIDVLGG